MYAIRSYYAEALAAWFARARVSPVLTAHPTEVQRQSILDCERGIARLVAQPAGEARDAALELLHAALREGSDPSGFRITSYNVCYTKLLRCRPPGSRS